ncbi:MAG TPA: hypothetical protein VFE05_02870 [Longimicrobiaceae bacterium]|nr:hypothetical protein [Longimicrobiaceae bacterium]
MRRAYLEWVEEQVEDFKDSIPRAKLLDLADEVATELRMSPDGQYQLTEILMCAAVDRRIIRLLKLPGYRAWAAQHRVSAAPQPHEPPHPELAPHEPARITVPRIAPALAGYDAAACVV